MSATPSDLTKDSKQTIVFYGKRLYFGAFEVGRHEGLGIFWKELVCSLQWQDLIQRLHREAPVLDSLDSEDEYEVIMTISLGVVGQCDALLLIGESPGANRERDLILSKGRPVYRSIDEIPAAS